MSEETQNPNPEPQAPEQSEPVIVYKAAGYDSVQVGTKIPFESGFVTKSTTFHRGEVIPNEFLDEDEIDRLIVLGAIEPVDLPAD